MRLLRQRLETWRRRIDHGELIGVDPELPPSLVGLEERPEHYESMSGEYEPFRDWLLGTFGKR